MTSDDAVISVSRSLSIFSQSTVPRRRYLNDNYLETRFRNKKGVHQDSFLFLLLEKFSPFGEIAANRICFYDAGSKGL